MGMTTTTGIVSEQEFIKLITKRANSLLNTCRHLSEHTAPKTILTRPFLGKLLSQSSQVEELLDAYGAANNQQWCRFRSLVAAIKLFADVSYELLHIESVLPQYRLLPLQNDYSEATEQALIFTGRILVRACKRLVSHAEVIGVPVANREFNDENFFEILPSGRLSQDNARRNIEDVGKMVTFVATAFLNMTADRTLLNISSCERPIDYASYMDSPISEENLRNLQLSFHNLQSLYDTFVSKSDTESLDPDLPVLRGHISVVLHLLRVATSLAHYYERHMSIHELPCSIYKEPLVKPVTLLAYLMDYSIYYVKQYVLCAQKLCRDSLKKYAEISSLEVPVPRYRGFHVRPSTLISMIVLHYGSEVRMELNGQWYDASSPLELFRVNEEINARKRKWLMSQIVCLDLENHFSKYENVKDAVHDIVLKLAEESKLIIYEQPLEIKENIVGCDTLIGKSKEEIARLLAIGKIDIVTDLKVRFKGDKRVLQDIRLLAESGYGEDNYGNNIPLPCGLRYLRR